WKWRSATLAIWGRCVIVTTCARPASRQRVSATRCAVSPPIPASISSKTIVSPPATAAIASAIRDSSPPDAVSATGANGSPGLGPRGRGPGQQLLVRRRAEPAHGLGNAIELGLDVLEAPRIGLEARQKRPQLGGNLAQAKLDVAQLVAGPRKLRRQAFDRSDGT